MKKRIKIISLSVLLLCVVLAAGVLMPEAAVRIADRRSEKKQEEFETGTVSSFRLTDRLKLAEAYDQEMYVDVENGTILERSEAERTADKIAEELALYGIVDPISCEERSADPFMAVSSENLDVALLWRCTLSDKYGIRMTVIIDDESGKMLEFLYYGISSGTAADESGTADIGAEAEKMRKFCEDYYGLRAIGGKYEEDTDYVSTPSAQLSFVDEEGSRITLHFSLDPWMKACWWS